MSTSSSAVRKVANELRAQILNFEDGQMIGSEEDMIARFGVSRPTLRQAAALLVQEQLLTVKRGVGGGYFARRPDTKAVAHMIAIYLQTRHTSPEEIFHATSPIRAEMARLAARRCGKGSLDELKQFIKSEQQSQLDEPTHKGETKADYKLFLKSERTFGHILGELSGNKVLSLFIDILYDFCAMLRPDEDMYINHPERVTVYRRQRLRLAQAILEGDEDLAALAADRIAATHVEWQIEDMGRIIAKRPMTSLTDLTVALQADAQSGRRQASRATASTARPVPSLAASNNNGRKSR